MRSTTWNILLNLLIVRRCTYVHVCTFACKKKQTNKQIITTKDKQTTEKKKSKRLKFEDLQLITHSKGVLYF